MIFIHQTITTWALVLLSGGQVWANPLPTLESEDRIVEAQIAPNETRQIEPTTPGFDDAPPTQSHSTHRQERGQGSWYGAKFHGRRTAAGLRFNMFAITAAHRTLPLLSYVKVTMPETGAHIVVQITDRGPYAKKRIIDLSLGAAKALGLHAKGLAEVVVEPLDITSATP